jgi:hypothetical protein
MGRKYILCNPLKNWLYFTYKIYFIFLKQPSPQIWVVQWGSECQTSQVFEVNFS